jgi:hypothetical protein
MCAILLAACLSLPGQAVAPKRVTLSPEERAISAAIGQTAGRVEAIRQELAQPGLAPSKKLKLKKALLHAEARAREARQQAIEYQMHKDQQAFVTKMMPLWLEQQRLDAHFNIEAAKARAFQQIANTAEKARQDDLWIQWQRNQILASPPRR